MLANIMKFAWRNLLRNKRRTYFTLLAIVFGVVSLIFARSYISGILKNAIESIVKTQIGHIRIVSKEYLEMERILPKEALVEGLTTFKKELQQLKGIESIDERIRFNVLLSHRDANETAIAVGINPAETDKNLELSEAIIEGQYLEQKGLNLIIGKKLAEKLKVKVNDELLLVTTDINYSTYALPFNIRGIYETGYTHIDKHLLYIPLGKAQEMLDCGDAAHEVLLFLKNPDQAIVYRERILGMLSKINPNHSITVIPWQKNDMIENFPAMIRIYDVIIGVIMFIVGLVILNTMLMTVMERYHEIGVIKALGFKNWEVFSMILVEALYLGVIGSVTGGILGGALSAWVEKVGIDLDAMSGGIIDKIDVPIAFFSKRLYPDFTFAILFGSLVFGILVSLIAVLYPAYKSSRMLAVEAFRSELKV